VGKIIYFYFILYLILWIRKVNMQKKWKMKGRPDDTNGAEQFRRVRQPEWAQRSRWVRRPRRARRPKRVQQPEWARQSRRARRPRRAQWPEWLDDPDGLVCQPGRARRPRWALRPERARRPRMARRLGRGKLSGQDQWSNGSDNPNGSEDPNGPDNPDEPDDSNGALRHRLPDDLTGPSKPSGSTTRMSQTIRTSLMTQTGPTVWMARPSCRTV